MKAITLIVDNGDGSSSTHYFSSIEEAEKKQKLEELQGGITPEDPEEQEFELIDGEILVPRHYCSDLDHSELAELKELEEKYRRV